ncbi:hypothetical protein BC937DRAFT_86806 [Endogone sp. FLAS-F59071]|nr:hypothetical protein BC937DRAFT_86806 [Endogone sp. FLAS-F59071]|eukprot:RUS19859.1 hypothetical protein BC937DRAFT_86806 [Endogone sp. FLAS-F59071]
MCNFQTTMNLSNMFGLSPLSRDMAS